MLVSPTTTREALYVAATRGRHSNQLYVDTRWDPDPPTGHDPLTPTQTARHVLIGVLANQAAELSAHDQIRASHEAANSFTRLHAEYTTLARVADEERWSELLGRSGVSPEQLGRVRSSPAYGALLAALRDAEAHGLDAEDALPALVAGRTLVGVDDPAAVLHSRIDDWKRRAGPHRGGHQDLVAGIIPRARGVSDSDLARALEERDQAMERRAARLAAEAARTGAAWVRELGPRPCDPDRRAVWLHQLRVVAAYRDLWRITSSNPLGTLEDAGAIEQLGHRSRAVHAARRAMGISRDNRQPATDPASAHVLAAVREQEGVQR